MKVRVKVQCSPRLSLSFSQSLYSPSQLPSWAVEILFVSLCAPVQWWKRRKDRIEWRNTLAIDLVGEIHAQSIFTHSVKPAPIELIKETHKVKLSGENTMKHFVSLNST